MAPTRARITQGGNATAGPPGLPTAGEGPTRGLPLPRSAALLRVVVDQFRIGCEGRSSTACLRQGHAGQLTATSGPTLKNTRAAISGVGRLGLRRQGDAATK